MFVYMCIYKYRDVRKKIHIIIFTFNVIFQTRQLKTIHNSKVKSVKVIEYEGIRFKFMNKGVQYNNFKLVFYFFQVSK